MGHYETAYWESDPSGPTRRDRMQGAYHPYVPDEISNAGISLSSDAARACEAAAVALTELDATASYSTTAESLARIMLRSEAISSSRIEGLEMNARRLLEVEALDELGVSHRIDSTEAEVLGNINAMHEAVARASEPVSFSLADLQAVHTALLENTRLAEYGGVLRTSQNWIGGSWYHPLSASYVPPRPELVEPLLQDLVDFLNTSRLPALAVAAIAHAQFETIHPFVDGNGRTGRALVHVVLRRMGLCQHTAPPISLVLNTLKDQYLDALAEYRFDAESRDDAFRDQAISQWVEFFCYAAEVACARVRDFEGRMLDLRAQWQERVSPRRGSAAELLLDALPGNPVVSIASVARITGRSYPAARGAVRALEECGVLTQSSKNRKSGLYVASEVLEQFTLFERSVATPHGDTRIERPARPVPQRPGR